MLLVLDGAGCYAVAAAAAPADAAADAIAAGLPSAT